MVKLKISYALLSLLFLSVLGLSASAQDIPERAYFQVLNNKGKRLISPNIRHSFPDDVYSVQAPPEAMRGLMNNPNLDFVDFVNLYEPIAKPVCGDGVCQGNENKTCAQDCTSSGGGDTGGERTCFPNDQLPYNVTQVNGGYDGDGTGVVVSVLDTGARNHPDLTVALCKDATKRGIKNGCNDNNSVYHGTHSSGVVAANGGTDGLGIFGVAPAATLWVIKVCGNAFCFGDDIAAGIQYAANEGTNIINMSLGGSSPSSIIKAAIDNAVGVLVIASAGNRGPNPDTIGYPAAFYNVVAVAAVNSNYVVARFSSRGIDDGNDGSIVNREVELAAGGVSVESTNGDGCYSSLSGTSFSAPTVSGLAAVVWNQAGGTAAATRDYLISITDDITQASGGGAGSGFDIASGYGLPVAP